MDTSQWSAIFVEEDMELGERTFRSASGPRPDIFHMDWIDDSIFNLRDAYILFLTEDNLIIAGSKIYNVDLDTRQWFLNRVFNYLDLSEE